MSDRSRDPCPTPDGELPRVSIVITNYNGADVLPPTMRAVDALRNDRTQVVVVDDGSTDGSAEWVEAHHPYARVVRMGHNTGRLNEVRNAGIRAATHRSVLLMDHDVVLREGCLRRLLAVMENEPNVLCCTPRLVDRKDPDRIYSDGGGLHYLCVSTASARGTPVSRRPAGEPRSTIGGGVMLLDREELVAMGGFDEGYLRGWGDDGELHLRGRLSGRRVLHVPSAVAEHVTRPHGEERVGAQFYNRYRMLATAYSRRTLLLLAPVLIVFELGLTGLALMKGFVGLRLSALRRAWTSRRQFLRRRREIQERRRVPDAAVLRGGRLMHPDALDAGFLLRWSVRAVSLLSDIYWWTVRRWL